MMTPVPIVERTACPRVVATLAPADRERMVTGGTALLCSPRTEPLTEEHLPPHLRTPRRGPVATFRGIAPAPLPASPLDITPERITAYRAYRGWSQDQLAAAIGVCQEIISAWELNKRWPNLASLRKLYGSLESGCGDD